MLMAVTISRIDVAAMRPVNPKTANRSDARLDSVRRVLLSAGVYAAVFLAVRLWATFDYFHRQGRLCRGLILAFRLMQAGLVVLTFMRLRHDPLGAGLAQGKEDYNLNMIFWVFSQVSRG